MGFHLNVKALKIQPVCLLGEGGPESERTGDCHYVAVQLTGCTLTLLHSIHVILYGRMILITGPIFMVRSKIQELAKLLTWTMPKLYSGLELVLRLRPPVSMNGSNGIFGRATMFFK